MSTNKTVELTAVEVQALLHEDSAVEDPDRETVEMMPLTELVDDEPPPKQLARGSEAVPPADKLPITPRPRRERTTMRVADLVCDRDTPGED